MNYVDALVLVVLALSGLLGLLRGFVREALGLLAWVLAAYIAIGWSGALQPSLRRLIANPEIADPAAFFVVFVAALIVLSIVAGLLARLVRGTGLGGLDRTIGMLFGVLRGAAIVSAAYIGAGLLFAVPQWPDAVLHARFLPAAWRGAVWIADRIPDAYRPRVEPPPEGLKADSGRLLQSAPHGYARGHDEEAR